LDSHVLFHCHAPLLWRTALDLALLVDAHAFDGAQQIEYDAALHALIASIRAAEIRQPAVDAVLVAHSW
nr:hypothetical protein [Tanacetum cinerariifolium]